MHALIYYFLSPLNIPCVWLMRFLLIPTNFFFFFFLVRKSGRSNFLKLKSTSSRRSALFTHYETFSHHLLFRVKINFMVSFLHRSKLLHINWWWRWQTQAITNQTVVPWAFSQMILRCILLFVTLNLLKHLRFLKALKRQLVDMAWAFCIDSFASSILE